MRARAPGLAVTPWPVPTCSRPTYYGPTYYGPTYYGPTYSGHLDECRHARTSVSAATRWWTYLLWTYLLWTYLLWTYLLHTCSLHAYLPWGVSAAARRWTYLLLTYLLHTCLLHAYLPYAVSAAARRWRSSSWVGESFFPPRMPLRYSTCPTRTSRCTRGTRA